MVRLPRLPADGVHYSCSTIEGTFRTQDNLEEDRYYANYSYQNTFSVRDGDLFQLDCGAAGQVWPDLADYARAAVRTA